MRRVPGLVFLCSVVCISAFVYVCWVISYLNPLEISKRTPIQLRQDGWFLHNYREYVHEFEDFRTVVMNYWWLMVAHVVISFFVQVLTNYFTTVDSSIPLNDRFIKRIYPRVYFNIGVSLIFLYILNGNNVFFMIAIILGNYYLSQPNKLYSSIKTKHGRVRFRKLVVYGYNIVIFLYLVSPNTIHIDLWNKTRDYILSLSSNPTYRQNMEFFLPDWMFYSGIDAFTNWGVHMRLSFLRLISYSVDKINFEELEKEAIMMENIMFEQTGETPLPNGKKNESEILEVRTPISPPSSLSLRRKMKIREYGLLIYLYYQLYVPLFYSGPIINYNDFVQHANDKQTTFSVNHRSMFIEIMKVIGSFVFLEIFSHLCFFNSVFWRVRLWFKVFSDGQERFSTIEFMAIFYVSTLVFFWGKYYIIFGISRIWSYVDHMPVMNDLPVCSFMYSSGVQLVSTWHQSIFHWSMQYLVKEIYFNLFGNLSLLVSFAICIHGLHMDIIWKYVLFHVIPCSFEIIYEYLYKSDVLSVLIYSVFMMYIIPIHFTPFEISPKLVLMKLLGLQWYGTEYYSPWSTVFYLLLLFVVLGSKYYLIRMYTSEDAFVILRGLERKFFNSNFRGFSFRMDGKEEIVEIISEEPEESEEEEVVVVEDEVEM